MHCVAECGRGAGFIGRFSAKTCLLAVMRPLRAISSLEHAAIEKLIGERVRDFRHDAPPALCEVDEIYNWRARFSHPYQRDPCSRRKPRARRDKMLGLANG